MGKFAAPPVPSHGAAGIQPVAARKPAGNVPHHASVLACGLLEDGGRALFLMRKNNLGIEAVEMPCVLIGKGENPVAALQAAFHAQTGIDAQVHEILFEKKWNAGTRKKKAWVPALIFKVTAKNASVRLMPGFSGYKWLFEKELAKYRHARTMQFL